jgi:hypothetical protein
MSTAPILTNPPYVLVEDISRFSWSRTPSGVTCTRTYHCLYDRAYDIAPDIGSLMADLPEAPVIEKVDITRPAPDIAQITVHARREFSGDADGPGDDQPVYEIDYGRSDAPLLANPRYTQDRDNTFNGKTLDSEVTISESGPQLANLNVPLKTDLEFTLATLIEHLKKCDPSDYQIYMSYIADTYPDEHALVKDYFDTLNAGNETYVVPAPVARITTRSGQLPTTSAVGKRQTPPGFARLPPGYQWLGTGDRAVRTGSSGKWERTREWTGATAWNTKVYPAD